MKADAHKLTALESDGSHAFPSQSHICMDSNRFILNRSSLVFMFPPFKRALDLCRKVLRILDFLK